MHFHKNQNKIKVLLDLLLQKMNFEYVQKLFTSEDTTEDYVDYYAEDEYSEYNENESTILDEIFEDEEYEEPSEPIFTNFFEEDEEMINFIPMKNKRYAEIEE